MTKIEKDILKKLVEHPSGLLSPADFINGIAGQNRKAVENLVAMGYVDEVPQDMKGIKLGSTYSLNFYRANERAIAYFGPWHKWAWSEFTRNSTPIIGVVSMIVSVFTLILVSIQTNATVQQAQLLQQQLEISRQENYPRITLKRDGQEFLLENSGDSPLILESISEYAKGKNSALESKSVLNIPEIMKPGDIYKLNLTVLGYETSIFYEIRVGIRNPKNNEKYLSVYEIKVDIDGTSIVNPKLFYKEIYLEK